MTRIWSTTPDCSALHWDCSLHPADHTDFLEMSGLYASVILTYGICDGRLTLHRHPVFPMLRIFPNNTHGSLQCDIPAEAVPTVLVNGKDRSLEKPKRKKRKHAKKVLRSETRVAEKLRAGDKVLNGELRRDLAFLARENASE